MEPLTKEKLFVTKELIDLWEKNELPMRRIYLKRIAERLYHLLDSGVPLSKIKTAIDNYAQSKWHRDNDRFVNMLKFLDLSYIEKWQQPYQFKRAAAYDEMMFTFDHLGGGN